MAKFVVYEKVSELVYQQIDKSKTSDRMATVINLGSGLMAGFAAAIISQPADTMLSKINKTKGLPGEGTTSRLIKIAKELGIRGSYTGIGARLFMVGTLTGMMTILSKIVFPIEVVMLKFNNSGPICNLRWHQEVSRCDGWCWDCKVEGAFWKAGRIHSKRAVWNCIFFFF